MDFFKHFRSFLGLPRRYDDSVFTDEDEFNDHTNEDISRYDAFSDPMEMHKYFEQQMSNIMENFGIFNFGQTSPFFGDDQLMIDFDTFNPEVPREGSRELRDQFLKPGIEKASRGPHEKLDKDIDGKFNIGDLDSALNGQHEITPHQYQKPPTRSFYGRSISSKTIVKPDGTMETHKTVRDHEGNEETIIIKKFGDKEHSIIKKKDKSGKEEIVENMINMDENDAVKIFTSPKNSSDKLPNWFPYDKFFK